MNKYVQSLKLAKGRLSVRTNQYVIDHESPYICVALRIIGNDHDDLELYCHRIIKYIDECIGGCGCSLESWLEQQGIIEGDWIKDDDLAEEMYQYRLRWIDELIRLYKGKKND